MAPPIKRTEKIMRRIYVLIWSFSDGSEFWFYVGRSYRVLDHVKGVHGDRLKGHRGSFNDWVDGKVVAKLCFYEWIQKMLKAAKGETHWRAKWGAQHDTLPEVRIQELDSKVMDDYEAEQMEVQYQEIHKKTIFNVVRGDGSGNPREVANKLIFGGIHFQKGKRHHHNPWRVHYSTGKKKRNSKGNIVNERYSKDFPTLKDAYAD